MNAATLALLATLTTAARMIEVGDTDGAMGVIAMVETDLDSMTLPAADRRAVDARISDLDARITALWSQAA